MGAGSSFLRRRLTVIFFLMAVLGVFGTVDGWTRARDDRAFDQRGKPALTLPETHLPASTSAGTEVSLSYIDANDNVVNAKPVALNQERLGAVRGGGRLQIVYLPDRPRTIRFVDWERQIVPFWAGPLITVAGAIGFVVLLRGRR